MKFLPWRERRTPAGAAKREEINRLRVQEDLGARMHVEETHKTTELRAQALDPRIRRVEVLADVLYRQIVVRA